MALDKCFSYDSSLLKVKVNRDSFIQLFFELFSIVIQHFDHDIIVIKLVTQSRGSVVCLSISAELDGHTAPSNLSAFNRYSTELCERLAIHNGCSLHCSYNSSSNNIYELNIPKSVSEKESMGSFLNEDNRIDEQNT